MVQVIADLEPVTEYWNRNWTRRELESLASELGDNNGHDNGYEESDEDLLQEKEIHGEENEENSELFDIMNREVG